MGGKLFENYGDAGHPITEASSVRCVLDLRPTDYSLQLCDLYESSKYGATRCYELNSGCQGAMNTNCNPYDLWSGTLQSGSVYYRGTLQSGVWSLNYYISTHAYSVRCVLDLRPTDYSLQLCDAYESSKYGAAQCYALAGGCQGALDSGSCYSYILWSCSSMGLYHTTYKLAGGSLVYTQGTCSSEGRCLTGYAFAVRCVLDLQHTAFLSRFAAVRRRKFFLRRCTVQQFRWRLPGGSLW